MAKVKFKRIANSTDINNIEIEDGSFIVTGDGKTYVDYNQNRIPTSGTPDSTISDTSRNTVENKVVKEYVDTEINNVNTNVNGLKPVLLWENSSPYSDFGSQTITLSSSDYDFLEVYYFNWKMPNYRQVQSVKVEKGYNCTLTTILRNDVNNMFVGASTMTYTSNTSYNFTVASGNEVGSSGYNVVPSVCIPIKIYGYKYS